MNNSELTQIVEKVQKDKSQFELLYSYIVNKVYFWCLTMAKNEALAKDMTQEIMIRIYEKIDEVKQPEYFSSWLYRVVSNSSSNYFRKIKKYSSEVLYEDDQNNDAEANIKEERAENLPVKALESKEQKEIIREFIDKLPKRQKEVIILYYYEEFKIKEIAEILNYNAGSVRSRLHSGRKSLKTQIDEYQAKHNIKLYSASILSTLGLILKEYSAEVCSNQNLEFNQKTFDTVSNASGTSTTSSATGASTTGAGTITIGGLTIVTSKLVIIAVTIICICTAAVITNALLNNTNQSEDSKSINNASLGFPNVMDEELFKQLKDHPYIEDITYLVFPMRDNVNIEIELKKDVDDKDTKILFDEKEMHYEREGNRIYIQATQNGIYTVTIKNRELSFRIDNIDEYAPELIEVFNENGYLVLNINDELSQLDYNKSFIKYQDKQYLLPKNLKIEGESEGNIKVILFCQEEKWIEYDLYIE